MKLLSASAVKTAKNNKLEELVARIKRLQSVEKNLLKSVNDLEAKEKAEKARIESDLTLVRNEAELAKEKLEIQKSVLFQEVRQLEGRREEALKPIHEIKQEADKYFEEAKQKVADAHKRALAVEEDAERLADGLDELADKKEVIELKILEFNRREAGIEAMEAELKREAEVIADKWIKYYDEVQSKTQEIERREKEILDNQKANENYKQQLELVAEEQERLKIGIKDGYESLKKAKQEILNNK